MKSPGDKAMGFGARVRLYRERLGLTQTELGALVGLDQPGISRLEDRQTPPSNKKLLKDLVEILKVTHDELVLGATIAVHEPVGMSLEASQELATARKLIGLLAELKMDNPERMLSQLAQLSADEQQWHSDLIDFMLLRRVRKHPDITERKRPPFIYPDINRKTRPKNTEHTVNE